VLDKAVDLCAESLYEALVAIEAGAVSRRRQEELHPVGFYCNVRRSGDEWLDWNWSSKRIFNFIRAISLPGPCARTLLGNKQVAVVRAELIHNAPPYIGTPGEVSGKNSRGVIVKTGDSTILIREVRDVLPDGSVGTESRIPNQKRGERFGLHPIEAYLELEKRISRLENGEYNR
jgi:methionyl-tRNA formyltransferase